MSTEPQKQALRQKDVHVWPCVYPLVSVSFEPVPIESHIFIVALVPVILDIDLVFSDILVIDVFEPTGFGTAHWFI